MVKQHISISASKTLPASMLENMATPKIRQGSSTPEIGKNWASINSNLKNLATSKNRKTWGVLQSCWIRHGSNQFYSRADNIVKHEPFIKLTNIQTIHALRLLKFFQSKLRLHLALLHPQQMT